MENFIFCAVPPKVGLFHYRKQTPSDSVWIKVTTGLNFDNVMYQAAAIFQKSSGFLLREPILSYSERHIV